MQSDTFELKDERIIRVADNLEQIQLINKMIDYHKNDEDDLMRSQYIYKRDRFLKEIGELLIELSIKPTELITN